jgi:predicted DNA-binding transcriptional regulator YafY
MLAIVLELQAKKWQRAEDLAETFEVSKRTIYRDLLALAESGVPVVSSPGQGYSLVEGYFLPPLSFTTEEAMVLLLGSDFMAQTFDAQYRSAAHAAGSKIEAVLDETLRDEVRYLQSSMRFIAMNPLEGTARPELLYQIRRAILQRKRLHFDYHTRYTDTGPAGEINSRDADPYALVHLDKAWYLVAYCHLRQGIRHFRLDRIENLRLLSTSFIRPQDFELNRQRRSEERPLTVRALFSHQVARWVQEERSFYLMTAEEHPDGLLLTFKIRQEAEIVQWLLSWGAQVRVLEPSSLIQRLVEEAQAVIQNHEIAESLLP